MGKKDNDRYGVAEILALAATTSGNAHKLKTLSKRDRRTLNQFVLRKLKRVTQGEDGRYLVSNQGARILIADNQNYFDDWFPPRRKYEEDELLDARDEVEERIDFEDYIPSVDEDLDRYRRQQQYWLEPDFEEPLPLAEDQIRDLMLRALFFKFFPSFSLEKLNEDNRRRAELSSELQIDPDSETKELYIRLTVEHNRISSRLERAIGGQDLTPYLLELDEEN